MFLPIQVHVSSQTKGLERGWKQRARHAGSSAWDSYTTLNQCWEKDPTVLQSNMSVDTGPICQLVYRLTYPLICWPTLNCVNMLTDMLTKYRSKVSQYTSRHPVNAVTVSCRWHIGGVSYDIICVSKIQLVVYYQCCILIGWATTRLYVIAH